MKTFRIILVVTLLAASPLRAQIVADGASVTLSNVTNSFPGNIIIGTNSSFTLLTVSDNALVGAGGDGIIGLNAASKSNEVRLISPTAFLFLSTNLSVGSNGAFNRLTISNGARVEDLNGFLGNRPFSSNNSALVTGVGSLWSNSSSLVVGFNGAGNLLVISNGARATSGEGILGSSGIASSNTVLVTGDGSTWSSGNRLIIGNFSRGCRMVVSNSAFVDNGVGSIGYGAIGSDTNFDHGDDCEVVVTGSGSVWSNRTSLTVGREGKSARLVVTNGGSVFALGDVRLGENFSSTNNRIVVGGGALRATNAAGTSALELRRGTNQFNAGVIEADQLRMTSTLGLFEFNGGLLTTRGAFITNGAPFVVGASGTTPAIWDVRPGVSNYFLGNDLQIGGGSSLNQLVITNGALLNNNNGILGSLASANSNLAFVAGPNSVWSNRSDLRIGGSGRNNQMIVSDGALVENNNGAIGFSASSSANSALVTGVGSRWANRSVLNVGETGSGNRLIVSDGGLVQCDFAEIGRNALSGHNEALITGPGSLWTMPSILLVGDSGNNNRLVVSNSATMRNTFGYMGFLGTNNTALVTGSGSLWTNVQDLYVGFSGLGNQLVVSDGGLVVNSNAVLGFDPSSSNNTALVTGSGSVWSNAVDLLIGRSGSRNVLTASNGAAVFAGKNGVLGANNGANSNSVFLGDAGTSWLIASNLFVGSNSAFNLLVVSNAALVADDSGIIGFGASSSNNVALVTGAGSVWSNATLFGFYVGQNGRGNQLVVSNGGVVRANGFASIGANSSSSNNAAVVTGSGSLWDTVNLYVGASGSGSRLVVTNGGVVRDNVGDIGVNSSGSNNVAVVTGSGSLWSNTFLVVGDGGPANQLVVSNGGVVFADNTVYVGFAVTSTNNRLTVDDGALRTTNAAGTGLLDVRRGTIVLNAGLIEVDTMRMTNSPQSIFEFNGGTLSARTSRIWSGTILRIGNGVSPATMILAGNGVHDFAGNLVTRVSSNAVITGNGTLVGGIAILSGGRLIPGASVGKMIFSNSPSLQGAVVMELSKNGAALTNDQIQVLAALTYGGSLVVNNLGPTALAAGDRFPLFSASSFAGGFTNIVLPSLPPGLGWTNKLLLDGSIEVVTGPQFTGVSLSGTNLIVSGTGGISNAPYAVLTATNVAEPLVNWVSLATNQFDAMGIFSFTNAIAPGELQRYFRIRTP